MEIIGIIGYGNMGQAIAASLKSKYNIFVFDKDKSKISDMEKIRLAPSASYLAKSVEKIILSVKPQDFSGLLEEIKELTVDKLVISIAAGIPTSYIESFLKKARVIRVMPNLALKINKGMTCISKGESANAEDLQFTVDLFQPMGKTLIVEEERMNAVTSISASAPAFFYELIKGRSLSEVKIYAKEIFVPALQKAAMEFGFNSEEAKLLAVTTAEGSIAFMDSVDSPLEELIDKIASKGGTTEAGLKVLRSAGSLEEALLAAKMRAEELLGEEKA